MKPTLRSLITLKALTYRPTGGIVAAATTSLPELTALRATGIIGSVGCAMPLSPYFRSWAQVTMRRRETGGTGWCVPPPAVRPRCRSWYGLAGERDLTERSLPWLPGYQGSAPVRVGNAAAHQLQLDVYGEVIDALDSARKG